MALFNTPGKFKQIATLSEPQLQAQRSLLQSGQQQLQNTPLNFAPQREQYLKQFNEQIIPTLAERFADNQRSSAFKGALGNTVTDFGSKLAGLESQYNLQANQQGLQQLLAGLRPEFENAFQPAQTGLLENLLSSLAQGVGAAAPVYLTGGLSGIGQGTQSGSNFMNLLSKLFSGGQQTQAQPQNFQSQFQRSQGNAVGSQQLMNIFQQLQQMLGGQ